MGLFGKKICAICGGKTGIITFRLAEDEKICTSCEKLLRGRFDLVRQGTAFRDTLNELELFNAKQIIDEMKALQQEDITRFASSCSGIISVLETFSVPTVGLNEGGAEIKALGGRIVALGFCEYGSFKQGDRIKVLGKGREKEATIIKLIPCTGAYPFEEELITGAHKTECAENTNAWLILNFENGEISRQDKILKKL